MNDKDKSIELIDITKNIEDNHDYFVINSKSLIIGMSFLTIIIIIAITIALLIKYLN